MTRAAAAMASATTVGEWMARMDPAPPSALQRRLCELVSASASRPVSDVPEACLEAGEQLLDALLASGSTTRATALDLLAVDSLITYAFQAAADDPARLEERAARAMARIAALPGALKG
ncbi:hypothetical protein [Gemmatimonas sp.]|uniref:hypothetical protein n=1 Tax=Gemmatimonas sp. TaxID=1962908 RepID=UPI0031C113BE|nr:hypothetical protein [Gemmatimonas sp.]